MTLTEEQKSKIEDIANQASVAFYKKKAMDAYCGAVANTIIAVQSVLRVLGYDLGDETWKSIPYGPDYAVFKVVEFEGK